MKRNETAVNFDRVSSEEQKKGHSLNAQEAAATEYAKKHNLKIVRSWSVDESASKENDRKHFFAMIEFVKEQGIKNVIFDKVDRACRGFKATVLVEDLVENHNVRCHFTRDHLVIDHHSAAHDKMRFYFGIIMAKTQIDDLRVEINKGLQQRKNEGLWNGKAPFGYRNSRDPNTKRSTVIPFQPEDRLIKELFERYSTGNYPLEYFVQRFRLACPNRTVTKRLIEDALSNPFYHGFMRSSRGAGPASLTKGVHEPLVSKDLWDQCQRIRGIRSANHQKVRFGLTPKPLMGLLKCGVCDHAVTGEAKSKTSGRIFIYYHCANMKCPERRKNTAQEKLLAQIEDAFEPFASFTAAATKSFIEALRDRLTDLDLYTQKKTGELANKRLEIKESIGKLEALHQQGALSKNEYAEVLRIREATLAEVKVQIDARNEADYQTFKKGLRVIELLTSIRDYMKKPGNELEKMRMAKLLLSNPKLTSGTLEYSYEKPFDVLIDLTAKKNWWRRWESNSISMYAAFDIE